MTGNPFPAADSDRHSIWQMLVERDIESFVQADWSLVDDDFQEESFFGLDARGRANPDSWRLSFPTLEAYREAWLEQSRRLLGRIDANALRRSLFDATTLRDIEVTGDVALAHKKFDGWIELGDGRRERLLWQTLYHCRRSEGSWRIAGFVGYLPAGLGGAEEQPAGKSLPENASQHVTAGPYSPVLTVGRGQLVVISGQAAIGDDGRVDGDTIEEQTRATLENCREQLLTAGCGLAGAFKVNVYLTDLDDWAAFNEIYREFMPEPRPVRTAVGSKLLPGLLVEVEMWAVRP